MVQIGINVPTGAIVAAGKPLIITGQNVETASNVIPGRLAKKGSTDFDIVACGAEAGAAGWVGFEDAGPSYRPATIATGYAAGDIAPLLRGGGFVILAKLTTTQTIVKGDRLVPAANGMLQKATAIAGVIPGAAGDTTPVTSTSAKPAVTMSGDVGALPIVAYAEQTLTTTDTAANILVRSVI